MRIKLGWVNRNTRPVTTRIYRTDVIKPNDQLGAPLVELNGSITSWIDTTVIRGNTYYYVFGVVGGPTELFSIPLKVEAIYSTGPGPSKLSEGDQSLGWFGTVTSQEFMTISELQTAVGISQGVVTIPLPNWDKWYRNGKILFVPQGLGHPSMSWNTVYSAGLMFGTDDAGPWRDVNAPAVNQMKIVSKGFNRFIVRTPTAADDRNNPTRVIPDTATSAIRRNSEISDLLFPMINVAVAPSQRFPRRLSANSIAFSNEGRGLIAQEKYKGVTLYGMPTSASNGTQLDALSTIALASGNGWKPILELIQSDLVIEGIVL